MTKITKKSKGGSKKQRPRVHIAIVPKAGIAEPEVAVSEDHGMYIAEITADHRMVDELLEHKENPRTFFQKLSDWLTR